GVFGLVLAFVFWIYFSGLILIAGAVVTSLHERRTVPAAVRKHRAAAYRRRRGTETEADAEAASEADRPADAPGPGTAHAPTP
ncbi:MAG TPA: hypothetical protein VF594_03040, partial [Rubricoccaceae bacterium]